MRDPERYQRLPYHTWWMLLPMAGFFFLAPVEAILSSLVYDDAFYYLQTAVNIVDGRGSSFDGVTRTNGYHPLWMMIIATIRVFVREKELFFRTVSFVSACFAVGAWYLFGLVLREYYGRMSGPGLLSFALFPLLFFFAVFGLETWLAMFLLLLFFRLALENDLWSRPYRSGLLVAALILARLDMVFPVAAILVLRFAEEPKKLIEMPSTVLRFSLPPVLLLCGYALTSYLYMGILYPISSLVKATGTLPEPIGYPGAVERFMMLMQFPWMILIASCLLIFGVLLVLRSNVSGRIMHYALLVGGCLQIIALITMTAWGEMIWYFYPHMIAMLFALPALLAPAKLLSQNSRTRRYFQVVVVTLFYVIFMYSKLRMDHFDHGHVALYRSACALRDFVPETSLSGTPFAGIVGYFSDRDVLDMDGLVADKEYLEMGMQGRIPQYLEQKGVEYILVPLKEELAGPTKIAYLSMTITPSDVIYSSPDFGPSVLRWVLIAFERDSRNLD